MSKIVKAVNAMISNPSLFQNVTMGRHDGEIFFRYTPKYCWSICKQAADAYHLAYYPNNPKPESLAAIDDIEWSDRAPTFVSYTTAELSTTEARASFAELYSLVNEKVYGMDKVLDEIIASDTDVPF